MLILKQSTATSILLGPFVDSSDGVTAEGGLTVTGIDVDVYKGVAKSDLTITASGGSNDMAHVANGFYSLELTAGNTDTVGPILVSANVSGAAPVWVKGQVVEETVYDALFGASAAGELAVKLSTQGKADVNAEADTAVAALNDLDAAGIRAALGMASADLDTQLDAIAGYIDTEVSSIISTLGTPADTSIATDIANFSALFTGSNAEPTGVPSATASALTKLATLYMMARNEVTVTATKKTYKDDAGNAEFEKDLSDDGTTYTESEVNAI